MTDQTSHQFSALLLIVMLLLPTTSLGQAPQKQAKKQPTAKEKTIRFEGKLKFGAHKLSLQQGRFYTVRVVADNYYPQIRMYDGTRSIYVNARSRSLGRKRIYSFQLIPPETKDYTLLIAPQSSTSVTQPSKLPYEIVINSAKPMMVAQEQLERSDPISPTTNGYSKTYQFRLKKGFAYNVMVSGTVGNMNLVLEDYEGNRLTQGRNLGNYSTIQFTPEKSGAYRMVASTYSLRTGTINAMVMKMSAVSTILTKKDEITNKDPLYANRTYAKNYKLKLKAGKNYVVDMDTQGFIGRMYLFDQNGRQVAYGSQRFVGKAQLQFTAAETGEYKLVATTSRFRATGKYKLIVQEQAVSMNDVGPPVRFPEVRRVPIRPNMVPNRGVGPGVDGAARERQLREKLRQLRLQMKEVEQIK